MIRVPDPLQKDDKAPDQPAPVLNYLSARLRTDEEFQFPNPAARWSAACGTLSVFIFFLNIAMLRARISLGAFENVFTSVAIVVWIGGVIGAILFGIIGYRRSRTPGVSGRSTAIRGFVLGMFGLAIILVAVATIYRMNQTYGPAGPVSRNKCQSNLRTIGQICEIYATRNDGKFPDRLDQLLLYGEFRPEELVCPATNDTPASGNTRKDVINDLSNPGHLSYVYIGAGLTTHSPAQSIVAYEKFENHVKSGINVLYVDGTAAWLDAKAAAKFIQTVSNSSTRPNAK